MGVNSKALTGKASREKLFPRMSVLTLCCNLLLRQF